MMQQGRWHARLLIASSSLWRMVEEVACSTASTSTPPSRRLSSLAAAAPTRCSCRCFSHTPRARAASSTAVKVKPKPKAKPKAKTKAGRKYAPNDQPVVLKEDTVLAVSYLPPPPPTSSSTAAPASTSTTTSRADEVVDGTFPRVHDLAAATALFTRPPPQFLYSAPRFLHLPRNTRIPEVCILGRSNVGKSTLLNALSGLESGGKAGRSHGARPGRAGLAITSARAGCTTMMNGYGFGPPLRPGAAPSLERVGADEEEEGGEAHPPDGKLLASSSSSSSRAQRRAQRPGEPVPAHSLVLLDMPGYGFMSRAQWGAEIGKYLQRRGALRGAVLLVDAVAGVKEGDRAALALLRDANVRTLVVLTKADKLLPAHLLKPPPASASESSSSESEPVPPLLDGERKVREACLQVWDTLRAVERESWGTVPWMQGQGWEPEIWVTGAGDPKGGGFGVAGARLAICRMAGLVQPDGGRGAEKKSKVPNWGKKQKGKGGKASAAAESLESAAPKMVPFDQIRWTETSTEATIDQSEELRFIAEQESSRKRKPAGREHGEPHEQHEELLKPSDANRTRSSGGRRRPWKRG